MISHNIPLDEESVKQFLHFDIFQEYQRLTEKRSGKKSTKRGGREPVALFLATQINRLDKKGRVSVPSIWRAALTGTDFSGLVLTPSAKHACLDGFNMERMSQMATALDNSFEFYSDSQMATATTFFGNAQPLGLDAEGRITMPDDLIAHANLSDSVAFVGLGQFFQVWEPEAFKAHQAAQRTFMQKYRLSMNLGEQK